MDDPFAVHFRKAAPGLRPDRRKLHRSTPQDTWKRSVIGEILHNLQSIIPTTTPTTNRPHFCRPRRELLVLSFLPSRFFESSFRFQNLRQSTFTAFEFCGNFISRQVAELIVINSVRGVGVSQ